MYKVKHPIILVALIFLLAACTSSKASESTQSSGVTPVIANTATPVPLTFTPIRISTVAPTFAKTVAASTPASAENRVTHGSFPTYAAATGIPVQAETLRLLVHDPGAEVWENGTLTNLCGIYCYSSAWSPALLSPDGQIIAFVKANHVMIANSDGTSPQILLDKRVWNERYPPEPDEDYEIRLGSWLPMTHQLLLQPYLQRGRPPLVRVDADSGEYVELGKCGEIDCDFLFPSPNGQMIATFYLEQFVVMDAQQGVLTNITLPEPGEKSRDLFISSVQWAPDSTYFYAALQYTDSSEAKKTAVWKVGINGEAPELMVRISGTFYRDAFSTDLKYVLYRAEHDNDDWLYSMNIETHARAEWGIIYGSGPEIEHYQWIPNTHQFYAYVREYSGDANGRLSSYFIVDLDQNPLQKSSYEISAGGGIARVRFPDSEHILFMGYRSVNWGNYFIELHNRTNGERAILVEAFARQCGDDFDFTLVDPSQVEKTPMPLPLPTSIAVDIVHTLTPPAPGYITLAYKHTHIMKEQIWLWQQGKSTLVLEDTEMRNISLSGDGQWISYQVASELWAVRSDGSQKVRLVGEDFFGRLESEPNRHPNTVYATKWLPGSHSVLFNIYEDFAMCGEGWNRGFGLFTVNVDTGEITLLAPIDITGEIYPAPNGRMIAISTGEKLYLVDRDGKDFREALSFTNVLNSTGPPHHPVVHWAPDSQSLIYITPERDPNSDSTYFPGYDRIWRIPIAGNPVRLAEFYADGTEHSKHLDHVSVDLSQVAYYECAHGDQAQCVWHLADIEMKSDIPLSCEDADQWGGFCWLPGGQQAVWLDTTHHIWTLQAGQISNPVLGDNPASMDVLLSQYVNAILYTESVGAITLAKWRDVNQSGELTWLEDVNEFTIVAASGIPLACSGSLTTRLHVGSYAYVNSYPALSNTVRENPGTDSEAIGKIMPGKSMKIIAGPECADEMVWWQVEDLETGLTGWTSEGDSNGYWLVPCVSDEGCGK